MLTQRTQIALNDLRFYAFHGALPQERTVGGWYVVTLRLDYPFAPAMASDRLADTLSYDDVYAVVRREMAVPSALLEHVAGRIITALCEAFPRIDGVEIEIKKENPPIGGESSSAAVIVNAKK